jgi:hypothetical protein
MKDMDYRYFLGLVNNKEIIFKLHPTGYIINPFIGGKITFVKFLYN